MKVITVAILLIILGAFAEILAWVLHAQARDFVGPMPFLAWLEIVVAWMPIGIGVAVPIRLCKRQLKFSCSPGTMLRMGSLASVRGSSDLRFALLL
jgi:hypothetical protein